MFAVGFVIVAAVIISLLFSPFDTAIDSVCRFPILSDDNPTDSLYTELETCLDWDLLAVPFGVE